MRGLRKAAAPSAPRTTQLPATCSAEPGSAKPNVSDRLSAPYYTVCTVGLNKPTFRSLDPRTESATEVPIHGPPSRMFVGTGVLNPGILPSLYGLAALEPTGNVTEVSGVYGMPASPSAQRITH